MAVANSGVAGYLEATVESGDRWEAMPASEGDGLWLPPEFWGLGLAVEEIEGPDGQPLAARIDAPGRCLRVSGLREALPAAWSALWLEYRTEGGWRLVVEAAVPPSAEPLTTEQGVPICPDPADVALVGPEAFRAATREEAALALRAVRLATHGGFDRLICLPLLRDMELLEHQLRTAKTVLRRFRGRAMLCDEVGLGKTIEAGIVLSELCLRGLVRSVLILAPPSLVEQWRGEMRRKFSLDCASYDDSDFRELGQDAWTRFDRIVASIHTAKREPHRSAICARRWDMVIVDEAHHLRNRTTQLWRFASQLQKQYILLLTATPVQNHLEELFNLVTLLEPGLLSTARRFQKRFVDRRDKLTPQHVEELHELLSEVMVRNRRSTVGLQFTRRWARTDYLSPADEERRLYEDVARLVRDQFRAAEGGHVSRMALLTLQMALGSSSQAAAGTLGRLAEQPSLAGELRRRLSDLAERAAAQPASAKLDRLLALLSEFGEKMVIFTQFRATQEMLGRRLREAGHEVALFHGGLSRLEKEAAIQAFRGPARLLLATESGSEGRNLQFAHAVCNFDLPWNPMKIEQRIGRLSRIGQTHDVHVFNLVAAGTVEAAVLHLLEAKLNMFELVIGEIDMILGNLDDSREFEDLVADLWADSEGMGQFAARMEDLGNRLVAAKEAYLRQRLHDDRLFGNRFAPDS